MRGWWSCSLEWAREMSKLIYHRLKLNDLPKLDDTESKFRLILVSDTTSPYEWKKAVADLLVNGGCGFAACWGVDCKEWHDAIDDANIDQFPEQDIPDEAFIMTSWHDDETIDEAFWFGKYCARSDSFDMHETVILHHGQIDRENELLELFEAQRWLGKSEHPV